MWHNANFNLGAQIAINRKFGLQIVLEKHRANLLKDGDEDGVLHVL
jgi:hypothetical protein